MAQEPQRSDQANEPCDERIEELGEKVGVEIEKAWTDQQTDGEALANIDEIVASAHPGSEPEEPSFSPEETQRLREAVKHVDWKQPTKSIKDRPPLPDSLQGPKGDPAEGKR